LQLARANGGLALQALPQRGIGQDRRYRLGQPLSVSRWHDCTLVFDEFW